MTRTALRERLALILGGTLVALILIELTLQGYGLYLERQRKILEPELEGKIRILALGESTTDNIGAPDNKSWTVFLEEKLNRSSRSKNIVVINKGRAGTHTDFLLQDLPMYIEKYRPHFLITMMGINDSVSLQFLHDDDFFSKLRIVRLVRTFLVPTPLTDPPLAIKDELGVVINSFEDVDKMPPAFYLWLKKHPDYQWYGYQLATVRSYWIAKGHADTTNTMPDYEVTYRLARKTLELNPYDELAFSKFLYASQEKYKPEAREFLKTLLKRGMVPSAMNATFLHVINVKEDPELIELLRVKGLQLKYGHPMNYLRRNYQQIVNIAKKASCRVAIMAYPTTNLQNYKAFFDHKAQLPSKPFILSFYEKINSDIAPEFKDLIFISNENFPRGFDRTYYKDQMLKDGFGHTTKKGHELIAENAWAALKDVELFR